MLTEALPMAITEAVSGYSPEQSGPIAGMQSRLDHNLQYLVFQTAPSRSCGDSECQRPQRIRSVCEANTVRIEQCRECRRPDVDRARSVPGSFPQPLV